MEGNIFVGLKPSPKGEELLCGAQDAECPYAIGQGEQRSCEQVRYEVSDAECPYAIGPIQARG